MVAVCNGAFRDLNMETDFSGLTLFWRELAAFLDEIPEGGGRSLERPIRFDLHFVDVGLARGVARHCSCLLALEGREKGDSGES